MTIERLRELEQAATPGPWDAVLDHEGCYVHADAVPPGLAPQLWDGCIASVSGPRDEVDSDAALIAAMRNALPVLLDVVEAARYVVSPERTEPGDGFMDLREALAALDKLP